MDKSKLEIVVQHLATKGIKAEIEHLPPIIYVIVNDVPLELSENEISYQYKDAIGEFTDWKQEGEFLNDGGEYIFKGYAFIPNFELAPDTVTLDVYHEEKLIGKVDGIYIPDYEVEDMDEMQDFEQKLEEYLKSNNLKLF